MAFPVLGRCRQRERLANRHRVGMVLTRWFRGHHNERIVMLKQIKALGIAGLTTLSASQLALAGPDSVLWSQHKDNAEVIVSGIKVAARTISRLNQHGPLVRFTDNEVGGMALVRLVP